MGTKSDTAREKKWRAQSDADTLAHAEVIRKDTARMAAAQKEAISMSKDQQQRADSLKNIAGVHGKTPSKANKTAPAKTGNVKAQQNVNIPGKKK